MDRRLVLLLSVISLSLLAVQGCSDIFGSGDCAGVGIPGIIVEVRTASGAPAALGATLIAVDGAFADTVGPTLGNPSGGYVVDSLRIAGVWNRRGQYQVQVSKPYWTTATRLVTVPGGDCGDVETQRVMVTMDRMPGAPAVRSVAVFPRAMRFGFCGSAGYLSAWVEADPGVSGAVRWVSTDSLIASVSDAGLVRDISRGRTTIQAISVADSAVRGIATIQVDPTC